MGGNQVSKRHRYIDETKVFVPAVTPANGTREHLNATKLPNDPTAKTEWTYLLTDGSDDGQYLKSAP